MTFTVEYEVGGGTPNYTVTLDGPVNLVNVHNSNGTFSFTGVTAGNYTLTVEDSLTCMSVVNVDIAVPPTTTTTTTLAPCTVNVYDASSPALPSGLGNDVSFIYSISGGTAPYEVEIKDLTGQITITGKTEPIPSTGLVIGPLFIGNTIDSAQIIITDDVGCTDVESVSWASTVPEYKMLFGNVEVIDGGGGNDGTEESPFDSNSQLDFSVLGNGGTGFTNPESYQLQLLITTEADSSLVGIEYQGDFYTNLETVVLSSPRGILVSPTQSDSFIGGSGAGPTQHSFRLINANPGSGAVATINVELFRPSTGFTEDIITFVVNSGGSIS